MSTPSTSYGLVSPEVIHWAAQQVLRQHNEPDSPDRATGRCAQCAPNGCRLLGWAQHTITVLPAVPNAAALAIQPPTI